MSAVTRLDLPPASSDGEAAHGAVDSHAHVFRSNLPLAGGRRYAPDYDALPEQYLGLLDRHAIDHAILVQPSFLGTDNRYLLDTIAAHPSRLRGVAVVDADIDEDQLVALAASGIVGLRLNLIGRPVPDLRTGQWRRFVERASSEALHVELHCAASDLPALVPALIDGGVQVVVDHFGRPDGALGIHDPGFRFLLGTATTDAVWVKLSAPYRLDRSRGDSIAEQALPRLLDAFGTRRLVWGSDWPHTQHESGASYETACRSLCRWLRDAAERRAVLVDTPARLFGLRSGRQVATPIPQAGR